MAESPKENSVDLLAGTPKENFIPSGENTSGENLKHQLDRVDSTNYCVVHKCVQFVTQHSLDQKEDNVSEMADDDGNGSNTNSNAVNSHKSDESAGSFVSNNSPRFTNR
jgi:hypothetical protein